MCCEKHGHPWPDPVLNGVEPGGVADAPFPIKDGQAPGGEDPDHPWELDAHSLVRDFFGEQLRSRRTARIGKKAIGACSPRWPRLLGRPVNSHSGTNKDAA